MRCLQAVQLVPLPEGVPEVLDVTCNGRSGKLLVRSQRVLHCDAEMSASKFEQVCGKGDAKKWKSSIWTEDADGQQDVVCMLLPMTVISNNLCAQFFTYTCTSCACFLPSVAVHTPEHFVGSYKAVLQFSGNCSLKCTHQTSEIMLLQYRGMRAAFLPAYLPSVICTTSLASCTHDY